MAHNHDAASAAFEQSPGHFVLVVWRVGMVLARSCALSAVSHLLTTGMRRKEQTARQQRLQGRQRKFAFAQGTTTIEQKVRTITADALKSLLQLVE